MMAFFYPPGPVPRPALAAPRSLPPPPAPRPPPAGPRRHCSRSGRRNLPRRRPQGAAREAPRARRSITRELVCTLFLHEAACLTGLLLCGLHRALSLPPAASSLSPMWVMRAAAGVGGRVRRGGRGLPRGSQRRGRRRKKATAPRTNEFSSLSLSLALSLSFSLCVSVPLSR